MNQSATVEQYFELSYYIPRIHVSVTESDIRYVLMNILHEPFSSLPFPSRIDINEIPNNKHFKSAFIYHECYDEEEIKSGKYIDQLIKNSSNSTSNQNENFKINCGILTPNNPNAYWILLPNYNQLTKYAKYMTDELKEIGDEICTLLYILSYSNVDIPINIDLYLDDSRPTTILSSQENEQFIAEKLQNAFQTKEKLENLARTYHLILPKDLSILYKFEKEDDVIVTY